MTRVNRSVIVLLASWLALPGAPSWGDMSRGEVLDGTSDHTAAGGDALTSEERCALPAARRPQRVSVVWHDAAGLLPAGLDEISANVTAVFHDAGVQIDWYQATQPLTLPPDGLEVPVVLLSEDRRPGREGHNALAATWRGSEPRTVWLYLGAFWRTLGRGSLPPRLSPADASALARPLSHVIVHELIHALAPAREHRHTGLLKSVYGRSDLTAPLGGWEALEIRRLLMGPTREASLAETIAQQ